MRKRKIQKGLQQERIILTALLFEKCFKKAYRPERRDLFNFIGSENLIRIEDEDRSIVSTQQENWENDLDWQLNKLNKKGLIDRSCAGHVALTASGEDEAVRWIAACKSLHDSASFIPVMSVCPVMFEHFLLTESLFEMATNLAGYLFRQGVLNLADFPTVPGNPKAAMNAVFQLCS